MTILSRLPTLAARSISRMAAAEAINPAKRQRSTPLIGTHSGTFHADEALAVYLVKQLEEYKDADLVRTRDPSKLAECDIVLDVGGVYDASTHRYDHHQRGFEETFSPSHSTKLSSAGLVYKHFGQRLVQQEVARLATASSEEQKEQVEVLFPRLYEGFVEGLDGIDNGIQQYEAQDGSALKQRYSSRTDLSARVGQLNPSWNEETSDKSQDERFEVASALAGGEFYAALGRAIKSWWPARSLVENAVKGRKQYDSQGRVILFEGYAPWKEHLFNLEASLNIPDAEKPLYVIYPDESSKWRVQCVPMSPESFTSRKALPEPWRGVRDQALSDLSGIPGCIFVHASGFIGGNATREGAEEMVRKALEM